TNDQYYAFANLFSRVRAKGWGGDPRNGDGLRTLYVEPRGDLIQPRTGKPQAPAPLDGSPLDPNDPTDRRLQLAEWLTSKENPHFARSIANRIWAAYFGKGLVDPVDDLRASNPATNEPLLAELSQHLIDQDFDLKALMKYILTSDTYQRSSETIPANVEDTKYLSRYHPRRMMAEVLHDAIASVSGVPTTFDQIIIRDGSTQKTEFYEEGTRAIQLYDSAVASRFLSTFGRNPRDISCECERSGEPSMIQVLHLSNGNTLNDKLAHEKSVCTTMIEKSPSTIIEEAYLTCLSRFPTDEERGKFEAIFAATPPENMLETIQDLFWALMSSTEFLFQR
ncbi:MAG: DUF1553 domain-containing protein, partial [Verrucomicrobiota bacterium]